MTKQEIRKLIKSRAAAFTRYREASFAICTKILASSQFKAAEVILAYMGLPDEADLSHLIQTALQQNKKVYIPKVFPETNTIEFYRYFAATLTAPGNYGIQEPTFASHANTQNAPEQFHPETETAPALILVPGRAFTADGRRLGRGKGYYDRYLARLNKKAGTSGTTTPAVTLAGVCLPFQLLEDLPADAHDIRMDFIFQE